MWSILTTFRTSGVIPRSKVHGRNSHSRYFTGYTVCLSWDATFRVLGNHEVNSGHRVVIFWFNLTLLWTLSVIPIHSKSVKRKNDRFWTIDRFLVFSTEPFFLKITLSSSSEEHSGDIVTKLLKSDLNKVRD